MTAEEIYCSIRSFTVSADAGIKLIENYGLQRKRHAEKVLTEDTSAAEMMKMSETINRISAKLDELFEKTAEACKKK